MMHIQETSLTSGKLLFAAEECVERCQISRLLLKPVPRTLVPDPGTYTRTLDPGPRPWIRTLKNLDPEKPGL